MPVEELSAARGGKEDALRLRVDVQSHGHGGHQGEETRQRVQHRDRQQALAQVQAHDDGALGIGQDYLVVPLIMNLSWPRLPSSDLLTKD